MNITLKYLIIGDAGVGKTSFTNQFAKEVFEEHEHIPTCGCEFQSKTILRSNISYKIQIWDTAGQEEYQAVTKSFYRNVAVVIFAFDLTNPESFTNLSNWNEIMEEFSHDFQVKILIGTKSDAQEDNSNINLISETEIQSFIKKHDFLGYYETSSKESKNVDIVFNKSLDKIIENLNSIDYDNNESINYGVRISQPKSYLNWGAIDGGRQSIKNTVLPKEESQDAKGGLSGCTNGCCL